MRDKSYDSIIKKDFVVASAFNEAFNLLKVSDPDSRNFLLIDQTTQEEVLNAIERTQGTWLSRIAKLIRPTKLLQQEIEIVQLGKDLAETRDAASIDVVTGVYSRRFFDTYLSKEFSRMARESEGNSENVPGVAILTLDLDNFKAVNDAHGHPVGDQVLRIVGDALQVRMDDIVSRVGGDELALIMHTSKYDELKKLYFGNDEFTGSAEGSFLRKINELIYSGLLEKFDDPDTIWTPVMYNGVRTYFSAGMAFQGLDAVREVRGDLVKVQKLKDDLVNLSDSLSFTAKRDRKSERPK